MMTVLLYSNALVIAWQVTHQMAVKAVSPGSNPFAVLTIVYGLAFVACIVLSPFAGKPIAFADFKRLSIWPTGMLALAVVGIEYGYFPAYRSGLRLGTTFAVTSVATCPPWRCSVAYSFGSSLTRSGQLGLFDSE